MKHPAIEARDFDGIIAASEAPEVTPFPSAQIFLTGGGPGAREKPAGFSKIALQPRLVGEIDVCGVEISPGAVAFHFRFALRELRGLMSFLFGAQ